MSEFLKIHFLTKIIKKSGNFGIFSGLRRIYLKKNFTQPSAFQDSQSKLVLKVPIQKREEGNTISSNSINMNDTNEYGYEQPQAPKF